MTKQTLTNTMLAGALMLTPMLAATGSTNSNEDLARKVRHELVLLPFLGVFDNMALRVEDGVVTLKGHVTRPTLKSSAERVASQVEGVKAVVNEIEVLPLSPYDDRVRLAVLRSVYGASSLQRYGMGAQPSIRIIVKNGEVTLEGVVSNEMDKNIAYLNANGVSGVFKVHNNLRVEKASMRKA